MAMFSSAEQLWNDSDSVAWGEGNESSLAPQRDERNYYAMLYSLLILAIVFGNVLVCLAVLRERSLQTTTNYLVVSLAVADLLVASLVMPWVVYLEVRMCCSYSFWLPANSGAGSEVIILTIYPSDMNLKRILPSTNKMSHLEYSK